MLLFFVSSLFFCERSVGGGIDKLETSCAVCFSNLVQCSRCLLHGFFLREKKKENERGEKAHEYTGSGDRRACVKLSFFSFVFAFLYLCLLSWKSSQRFIIIIFLYMANSQAPRSNGNILVAPPGRLHGCTMCICVERLHSVLFFSLPFVFLIFSLSDYCWLRDASSAVINSTLVLLFLIPVTHTHTEKDTQSQTPLQSRREK